MRKRWLIAVLAVTACGKSDPDPAPVDAGVDSGMKATMDVSSEKDAADAAVSADCTPVFLGADDEPFQTLSEYCLFADGPGQTPSDGILPFEPIAVLYADESLKQRFIAVPPGKAITFDADERWSYPDGTILIKTFYYFDDARTPEQGRRLLETRLIVNRGGTWEPYIYVWNDEQTEAQFERLGGWVDFERVDDEGATVQTRYRIPNKNQCGSCHDQNDKLVPLGPRAFQLNKEYDYGGELGTMNQLEAWAQEGILTGVPADLSTQFTLADYLDDGAELDKRARSYLEVNCAHCHADGGAADPSGLRLSVTVTEPGELGVCRRPVAAGAGSGGLFYDIAPGQPENSIVVYRMSSVDPEIKMPELPTQTADDFGVLLIRDWISAMTPVGCPEN